MTVTVNFRTDAEPDVMQAFFDGFSAGSFNASPERFGVKLADRRMTATYASRDEAAPFAYAAERSAAVASVSVDVAGPAPACPEGHDTCGVIGDR